MLGQGSLGGVGLGGCWGLAANVTGRAALHEGHKGIWTSQHTTAHHSVHHSTPMYVPLLTCASIVNPGVLWKGVPATLAGPYASTVVGAKFAGQPGPGIGAAGRIVCWI